MLAVPSVVLMIPRFLVIKQLGLYDTYGGMIIPLLADAAGIFIMKQFFESVPASIEDRPEPISSSGMSLAEASISRRG